MYQMEFPEASDKNYVKIENVFTEEITNFSVCFWAKFPAINLASGIFAYSTEGKPDQISVHFINENSKLTFFINKEGIDQGLV